MNVTKAKFGIVMVNTPYRNFALVGYIQHRKNFIGVTPKDGDMDFFIHKDDVKWIILDPEDD